MKKNLFRILSLVLVLATCFTLFACNDGSDGEDEDEGFNPYPYKDLSVYMDLPDYKSVSISRTKLDELVNNTITNFLAKNDLYEQVFDRKVQNGDKVNFFTSFGNGTHPAYLSRSGDYYIFEIKLDGQPKKCKVDIVVLK